MGVQASSFDLVSIIEAVGDLYILEFDFALYI
jgi:hypothetical protein